MRIYDGAAPGRRATAWRTRHTAANAEIQTALRALRDRARDLVRNTPHASRILNVWVNHAVGTGLRPVCKTGAAGLDKRVQQLWEDWQASADVEGVLSFAGQQCLAVRSMIESGEVVIRFIDRKPDDPDVETPVPLKIQLLEADFIDQYREGIYGMTPGRGDLGDLGLTAETKRSRLGVGLGDYDRRTGLWLFPWHPGEITTYNLRPGISRFVQKSEVLHVYMPWRPGQVRGVSWFAPVLQTARELFDFQDATLMKAKVEACFAAFIVNSEEYSPLLDETPADAAPQSWPSMYNPNALSTTLEPGMIKELKSGQDIKFAQPSSAFQVEPMLMFNQMAMAAGVGVTYDQLSGDLRGANYSSLRAGKIDFRRAVEQVQKLCVEPMLCKPVWDRFINRAIMAGELRERKGGYPVEWVTPAWESVNPKFDLDAEQHAVRSGRMTPQEFIGSWGGDWRQVLDDFEEFQKECAQRGIVLDLLPSQTTRQGQLQKVIKAPKPGAKANGAANGKANGSANGFGAPDPAAQAAGVSDGEGGVTIIGAEGEGK